MSCCITLRLKMVQRQLELNNKFGKRGDVVMLRDLLDRLFGYIVFAIGFIAMGALVLFVGVPLLDKFTGSSIESIEDSVPEKQYYGIGEYVNVHNRYEFIVHSVEYVETWESIVGSILQPDESYAILRVHIEASNISNNREVFVSSHAFSIYDSTDEIMEVKLGKDSIQGTISPGKRVTGYVYYIVDPDETDFELIPSLSRESGPPVYFTTDGFTTQY